jgi:hypothetical protein
MFELIFIWNFNITLCSPWDYEMQNFISNGCVKQILFLCCTYKEQYKVYKQHSGNGITYEKMS